MCQKINFCITQYGELCWIGSGSRLDGTVSGSSITGMHALAAWLPIAGIYSYIIQYE